MQATNPVSEILSAIRTYKPRSDPGKVQNILAKLRRFNETRPAQVSRKMRIVYFDSRIENPQVHY